MKPAFLVLTVVVVLILATLVGYFLFVGTISKPHAATPSAASGASVASAQPTAVTAVLVAYTDTGFSPKSLTVKAGTTVRFVNNSSGTMWIISGSHPACVNEMNTDNHFGQCAAVTPSTVYSFTFSTAGTFAFRNKVRPADSGTILVTK